MGTQELPPWDCFDRLRELRRASDNALVATYLYDAGNRRVRKDLASGTDVDYYYSGWQILEERRAADGAVLRQRVDSPNYIDEHLELTSYADSQGAPQGSVQARRYYLQNTLFSVYALTDDGQTSAGVRILEAYEYEPYGKHTLLTDGDSDGQVNFDPTDNRTPAGASALGNGYTFTGREFDPESGLHHYRNRHFDARSGRFISRDTFSNLGTYRSYHYASSAPINHVDPLGLWALSVHKKISQEALDKIKDDPDCFCNFNTQGDLGRYRKRVSKKIMNNLKNFANGLKEGSTYPDTLWEVDWYNPFTVSGSISHFALPVEGDFWESHWGDKAFWHGMRSNENSAQELKDKIQDRILGKALNAQEHFWGDPKGSGFTIGEGMHTLEDTFCEAHVIRSGGVISHFQEYSAQSASKHREGDNRTIDYAGAVNAVADIMKRAICQGQSKDELRQAIDGYLQINGGTQFTGADPNYIPK